jgi:hypothetical protein
MIHWDTRKMRRVLLTPINEPVVFLIVLVGIVGAVVSLRWMVELVANSGRGLDASDESFYLLSVRYPQASTSAVTGFDSYLAPIWWLCGGSIARYRVAGMVIVLGAAGVTAGLSGLCSRRYLSVFGWSASPATVLCATALCSLSLTHYVLWITTPGYNLVVLVVALLVAGMTAWLGLTPASHSPTDTDRRWRLSIQAALGFALSIGIVVKAPAFGIIGVLSGVALVVTRGPMWFLSNLWRVAVGFVSGLLFFVVITGSPTDIVRRFSRGLHASAILGSHGSESLWETTAMREVYGPWFLKYLVGALLIGVVWRLIRSDEIRLLITIIGSVLTAFVFGLGLPAGGPAAFGGNAGWWWIRLSAMTLLWSTANARRASRMLALGPLLSLMAVGAAAGSGNGVVHEVVLTAGVFGVGALVHGRVVVSSRQARNENAEQLEVGKRSAAILLPIALFFAVGSLASNHELQGALAGPYRLNGGLSEEDESVDLGAFGKINVHPETARYVHELQAIAKRVPADARDCLVDLSGGTPLSAIALGVEPAASPWILGGYAGSNEFASYVLTGSPCLSGPYVLIETSDEIRKIARPAWLDTSGAVLLGRVQYSGYIREEQLVWLVP